MKKNDIKISAPESDDKQNGLREKSAGKSLRMKAEAYLQQHPGKPDKMSRLDLEELIHELGTYQIKLELQNDELRSVQQELQQSRQRLAHLYDFAPVGYFTLDPRGLITSANLTGAAILGVDKSQLANVPLSTFVHPDDADRFHIYLHRTALEQDKQAAEFRLQHKEGGHLHVQLESVPVRDDNGETTEIRTTLSDISERFQAERNRLRKSALLRAIIDSTDVMLVYLDPEFNFIWVNPAYAEACKMAPEEMAGKNHFDLYPHRENEEIFRRVRDTGEPVFFKDKPFEFPDQPELGITYWDWSLVPVRDPGGEIAALIFSLRETTKYKEAQEKIYRNNDLLQGIREIFEASLKCKMDDELAVEALRVAQRITKSRFGYIGEIGLDGLLHDMAISDPGREQCTMKDKAGHSSPGGSFRISGLYGRILSDEKAFFTNEPLSHPASIGTPEGHPPLHCFLGVPIVHAHRTIGIIALYNRKGGYSDEDVESIRTLSEAFAEILFKCRMERALAESRERERQNAKLFKQYFDFTPIPVWIAHDPECSIITSNLAAAELLGVEPDRNISLSARSELEKSPIKIFCDGRELDVQDMPMQYAVRNALPVDDVEIDIRTADNKIRKMMGSATPIYDADGKISGGISSFVDITERKRLEKQLLQAKQEWEKTFDAIPDLIALLDPENRIIRANRAMAEKLGLRPDQCIGTHCFDCIHGETKTIDACPNTRTLRDGREHTAIIHENKLGGDYLVTTTPFFSARGEIQATVHVARDITELKEAERLLRESRRRLLEAEKIAHLGSWELDTNDNALTWSDEVFRIFGLEPQSFTPCYDDYLAMVHPADREKVHGFYLDSVKSGKKGYEVEYRIIRKPDGAVRYLLEKCRHIHNESDQVVRSAGIVHDITKRKLAEEEVLSLNRQLQQTINELAELNREYERSNQDLQQYAYIISHDLREPLRTVSGFVQLLGRKYQEKLDDKAETFIQYALDGTARMQQMLHDLLEFSRVGGGDLHLKTIPLESVVEKSIAGLTRAITENRAKIEFDILPLVEADDLQLTHIFHNLIGNALKFRGEKEPRIRISAENRNDEWIISVRDNGIGIDPRFADRIFLLFQRLHRRDEYTGTGLGLAICKKIVERHGGQIWLESEPGIGSVFYFSLPAVQQDLKKTITEKEQ